MHSSIFVHHTLANKMKHLVTILSLTFLCSVVFAQQNKFTGTWEGDLDAGMQKLRLVFDIRETSAGHIKLTMQSPQQSAMQMPADTAFINGETIGMEMTKFNISFSGKLLNDTIIAGEFIQGAAFPLQLKKVEKASAVSKPKRPQTPKPPFTYKSIDVSFNNKNKSINFGATLTLPDTSGLQKYPAVILISGSGAQDRDETILGHKPFAVIADHLTKNGFAVLRVDDRGVGKTSGNHTTATSADFADDAEAALDFLQTNKWINPKQVGLIGHSEGGMIAPLLASRRKDIKAIVLLAGPGITGAKLLTEQNVAISKSNGTPAAVADSFGLLFENITQAIVMAKDSTAAKQNIKQLVQKWNVGDGTKKLFKLNTLNDIEAYTLEITHQLFSPWFKYFLSYNPAQALSGLQCSVLALNGSKDLQVLPQSNLAGIRKALNKSKSKSYEVKEIDGVNHLFQTCNKCSLDEYATLEETFSPAVLEIMNKWLQQNLK